MKKKPRVPRPLYNPIALATAGARKFTPDQLAKLMAPNTAALEALRTGAFDDNHWRDLADAFHIAEALARPPVNIANDHADKFEEAQTVLYALSEQFRDRKTWTARAPQLAAVQDALEIFEIQLQNVAQGEFERAVERIKRRMIEALRGNGGKVQLVEALPC
jgi:hypothetical protein